MEYNKNMQIIATGDMVAENKTEQPIEGDFLLADYFSEISQILKCIPDVQVMSKQVMEDKIILDGYVNLKILYLSPEDNGVNCYEQTIPFNKVIELKSGMESHFVQVNPKVDYINCRAVNQRRIDVRGAVSFEVKSLVSTKTEMNMELKEDTLETKTKDLHWDNLICGKEKCFTMNEMMSIPCDELNDIVILRVKKQIYVTDYKCIADKIIVKGEIEFEIVYKENKMDPEINRYKHSIPLSQIVDVEGVEEGCDCFVVCDILSGTMEPAGEGSTEISLSIYGCIQVRAYKSEVVSTVVDAYSTKYEMEMKTVNVRMDQVEKLGMEKVSERLVLEDFLESGCLVEDVFVLPTMKEEILEDGILKSIVQCDISCICKHPDGERVYKNKVEQITYPCKLQQNTQGNQLKTQVHCCKMDVSPNVNGTSLELRVEMQLMMLVVASRECTLVDEIEVDKEKEKCVDHTSALTIYYGDKGEKIWDIAKKYNTCVAEIMKQNHMETDQLKDRKMLLIPIVR